MYMIGQLLITCFNAQNFDYITFCTNEYPRSTNVYINAELNINPSSEVLGRVQNRLTGSTRFYGPVH